MHFQPILLVQAEDLEEAKRKAENFCENECGEHSFFDYGGVIPDNESDWNKPLLEVKDKLPVDTHVQDAKALIEKAHVELDGNDLGQAGYFFYKAGLLLQESFCSEADIYNIESYDYSRNLDVGWYAIEADFHF